MSVRQGEQLSEILRKTGVPWNAAWNGRPVVVDGDAPPVLELASGMRVTLLSPTSRELETMGVSWQKELRKRGFTEKNAASEVETDRDDDDVGKAAVQDETDSPQQAPAHGKEREQERESLDVEWLASRAFRGDGSVANGSSIALLAEYDGASVLIGGDAHDEVLQRTLRALLSQRGEKRLHVDAFVVPHAGSRSTLSVDLLQMLDCNRYLFSTDGSKFRHPDRVTVARILVHGRSDPSSPLTLIFNYRSETTAVWDSADLKSQHNYTTVYPSKGEDGIEVVLREGTDPTRAEAYP